MPLPAKKSLLGEIDLSHFDTPSLRRGVLLQAMVKPPGDEKFRKVTRTARQARQLGLIICGNADDYNVATSDAIEAACSAAGVSFGNFRVKRGDFIRSRYAPGLILDFPSFAFKVDKFKIGGRCCLTICFNDSASKIWTRLVLSEAQGRTPAMVPIGEAKKYFRIGSAICDNLIASIRGLYLRDFKSTLERGSNVNFRKLGNLTFVGIDEPLEVIEAAIEGVRKIGQDSSPPDSRRLRSKLASLFDFGAEGADADRSGKAAGDPALRVRAYQPSIGPTAMLLDNVADGSATIAIASARTGLVTGKRQSGGFDRSRPSSSLAVSKDLAHRIASKF